MKRDLIPGVWGRCGRAIPDAQASELDNVVPPRYPLEPLPNQPRRNRIPRIHQASSLKPWQRALAAATGCMAVLAAILAVWPA